MDFGSDITSSKKELISISHILLQYICMSFVVRKSASIRRFKGLIRRIPQRMDGYSKSCLSTTVPE